jgi:hypothetical protein
VAVPFPDVSFEVVTGLQIMLENSVGNRAIASVVARSGGLRRNGEYFRYNDVVGFAVSDEDAASFVRKASLSELHYFGR